MKTIQLKWNVPGLTTAAAAISGSVFSADEVQKVVLPANQPLSLEVKPGVPIVIRAQMPSGRIIQKTLKFADTPGLDQVVLADPATSEDPSFSLHSCLGALKKSALPQTNSPARFDLIESDAEKSFQSAVSSTVTSYLGSLKDKTAWEGFWLRVWSYEKDAPSPWVSHPAPVTPITFRSSSLIVQLGPLPSNRPCFLELGRDRALSRFVAIPPIDKLQIVIRPWWNPKLFDASGGRTVEFVSTDDQYARLQIALKYIQENAFTEAEMLINDMYSTMVEKADNPYGAAVGGYFLLKFGECSRIARMAGSFNQLHSWLPDSAIIYAWQLMSDESKNPDDPEQVRQVKAAIVESVHRGVPLFTIGLRFLFEQLRQLENKTSQQVAVATGFSEQVQYLGELLGACDQKQYLTTFFGLAPWRATRTFDPSFPIPLENRLPFSAMNIAWTFETDTPG